MHTHTTLCTVTRTKRVTNTRPFKTATHCSWVRPVRLSRIVPLRDCPARSKYVNDVRPVISVGTDPDSALLRRERNLCKDKHDRTVIALTRHTKASAHTCRLR